MESSDSNQISIQIDSKRSTQVESSIYETQCVERIISSLRLNYSSLPLLYCDNAIRQFREEDNFEAFSKTKDILRSNGWEQVHENNSLNFKELEVDCLLHVLEDQDNEEALSFEKLLHIVKPTSKWLEETQRTMQKAMAPLNKKISDAALEIEEAEANCYIVFEITLNPRLHLEKLSQLERILTFLLIRHQLKHGEEAASSIGQIVRLVGIASTKFYQNELILHLENNCDSLPMIRELWLMNRFTFFQSSFNPRYPAEKFVTVNSYSDIRSDISKINLDVLQVRKEIEEENLRKVRAENELIEKRKEIEEENLKRIRIENDLIQKRAQQEFKRLEQEREINELEAKQKIEKIEQETKKIEQEREINELEAKQKIEKIEQEGRKTGRSAAQFSSMDEFYQSLEHILKSDNLVNHIKTLFDEMGIKSIQVLLYLTEEEIDKYNFNFAQKKALLIALERL